MKGSIEFDLSDYDDRNRFVRYMSCDEAFSRLYDIDQKIRNLLKHGEDKDLEGEAIIRFLEEIRREINEACFMDLYE